MNIANSMSDPAAVNHATIEKVNTAWNKRLNELNCHLHQLDSMSSGCRSALSLSLHLFTALWQGDNFRTISTNPPEGCIIMILDFAENCACRYQDEVQSVHWGHSSATIHPIVAYYRCPTCSEPTTDSLIMITADNTHDHHAVHKFTQIAMDHLQQKVPKHHQSYPILGRMCDSI